MKIQPDFVQPAAEFIHTFKSLTPKHLTVWSTCKGSGMRHMYI